MRFAMAATSNGCRLFLKGASSEVLKSHCSSTLSSFNFVMCVVVWCGGGHECDAVRLPALSASRRVPAQPPAPHPSTQAAAGGKPGQTTRPAQSKRKEER